MTSPRQPTADPLAAVLLLITQHDERLASLDEREGQHYQQIAERLRDIAAQLSEMSARVDGAVGTIRDQAAILASLDGLDQQVAAIATQLAEIAPSLSDEHEDTGGGEQSYSPIPSPQWWKLTGPERDQ